ncbi:hypothetical protein [Actomonas aquatica]|uniref:DUF2490 domain-containing protein n=1 Tax=Actomonas aquatica TaxID=2866162 RepID=A0ABZ1C8K7_9BACT|nr:hypothetical protein [Opitutus sp. WL0086]WRQ86655.1 hypothetical protein K1X11_017725 [Opitutus sp. WL0086]
MTQPLAARLNAVWRAELRFDDNVRRVDSTLERASLAWRVGGPTQLSADLTHVNVRRQDPLSGDTINAEQVWVGVGQSSRWWLGESWGVALRDTLRWRYLDSRGSPTVMTRHYGELTWRTGRGPRGLQQLYCGFEWFAALSNKPRPEHWITPLGARIRGGEHWSANVYYFIRNRKFADGWQRQHVLGTFLNWQL